MSWPCRGNIIKQLLMIFMAIYFGGFLYFSLTTYPSQSVSMMDSASIDEIIKGRWKKAIAPVRYVPKSCQPQKNLAFIKCMKCATETLGTVFRRYGYLNNLSVVLPVERRIYLGWPYPITDLDYRPSSHGYNLLMEHAVYNGTFMRNLMNPGTVFLTMIREPLDLFVSTLNYFNVFQLANVSVKSGMEAVHAYLQKMQYYESVYKSPAAAARRYCIPDGFSVTKNLLAHCLGMPLGFPAGTQNISDDFTAVTDYIKKIDSEFLLVMLVEYFEESLVLMKRLLCWDIKDIIYFSNNRGSYRKNISWSLLTESDRTLHQAWSRVDFLLYDHFNRTFWRKVHGQGKGFDQELAFFKDVQQQVTNFCHKVTPYGDSYIHFPESPWAPPFSFTAAECRLMAGHLLDTLKKQYLIQEPEHVNFSTANSPRKFVPLC